MTLRTSSKALLALTVGALLIAICPAPAFADDFGEIVHRIEVRYHAHRNYRFLMAFAGLTVKLCPGIGVHDVKIAYFENQSLFPSDPDKELDEILQHTGSNGWQPMVRSRSRHRGELSYVFARPAGKDLRLLVVNLERNEAEVIEVKINPDQLEKFIAGHNHEHHSHEDVM